MSYLTDMCRLTSLNSDIIKKSKPFSCGDKDLDDFFSSEAVLYEKQLLGKSYCYFLDKDPSSIVCAFTLSNDSIKADSLPNSREKKIRSLIPYPKRMHRYPGVLIGRLGINTVYSHTGLGSQLLDFIKAWFVDTSNKTGCRFIIVDAYNEDVPIAFYQKNGFKFLFSTENQEKENSKLPVETKLRTRMMYYDLINFSGLK